MKPTNQKKRKIRRNFTVADVNREAREREAFLKEAGLRDSINGGEAAYEDLTNVELCGDLAGKFARESARKTGDAIGDVRDNYGRMVIELLAERYTQTDGKRYSLGAVLRGKYESDSALKKFLPKFAKWIDEYVSDCVSEHSFGFNPLYRQIVPSHTWTLCGHSVSRELLTALAKEYVRHRVGLMGFLLAVFKRWRKLFAPYSAWRVRLLAQQITGTSDEVAAAMETIGAAKRNSRSLGDRIRQNRLRDQRAAAKRRVEIHPATELKHWLECPSCGSKWTDRISICPHCKVATRKKSL